MAHFPEYPGPRYLGPLAERHRLLRGNATSDIDHFLTYCTNCKRCDIACPHNVRPAHYNLKNKAGCREKPVHSLRNFVLAHNVWWGKAASRIPGFANFMLGLFPVRFLMGLIEIAPRKFPAYKKSMYRRSDKKREKKAVYFPGCYARFNEPDIIAATISILEACEYQVEVAPLDCCGIPMLTNSLVSESRVIAEKNTDILTGYLEEGYRIVTTCSSCGLALKEEYMELLPREKALKLSREGGILELFELLQEEERLPEAPKSEKLQKIYYHVPCHLKAQGIGVPAARLLRRYTASEIFIQDSYCCGIAGTYGFKKEKFELSMKIGSPLFEDIRTQAPEWVITDCGTCAIQIKLGAGVEVVHPVILLRELLCI